MWYVFWSVVSYYIAREVAKQNEDLKIKPLAYLIGTVFFSFLGTMSFLGYKVSAHKGNSVGKIISILGIVLAVIINIALL